jgi:hypothetical protein
LPELAVILAQRIKRLRSSLNAQADKAFVVRPSRAQDATGAAKIARGRWPPTIVALREERHRDASLERP